MPKIETERVAEALLDVCSRVGFPTEILSDKDSQYTSDLMKEVCRLISLKQLFTTSSNPKCNIPYEIMNGVFKSMLKKMCQEKPKDDWDRYYLQFCLHTEKFHKHQQGSHHSNHCMEERGPIQVLKEL